MDTKKRRGVGCLIVMMVGLAGLSVLGITLAGLSGGSSGGPAVTEKVESTAPGAKKKLVILPIHGVIVGGQGTRSVTGSVLEMLDRAMEDDAVAAVLLDIDTPGGAVTDADLIHRKVTALRAKGRKVMVLMGDLCASGGYYVAVAAEEIWAHPTTITGSIGVIIPNLNVSDLMARYGVADLSVASGENKAVLSPTRPQTPAQRALIQGVVDELYERFLGLVVAGRGLTDAEVRPLADGRIFTANTAKAARLIDAIGYEDEALKHLREAVGEPLTVVRYGRLPSVWELVGVRTTVGPLETVERLLAAPRAMYLYAPW